MEEYAYAFWLNVTCEDQYHTCNTIQGNGTFFLAQIVNIK